MKCLGTFVCNFPLQVCYSVAIMLLGSACDVFQHCSGFQVLLLLATHCTIIVLVWLNGVWVFFLIARLIQNKALDFVLQI